MAPLSKNSGFFRFRISVPQFWVPFILLNFTVLALTAVLGRESQANFLFLGLSCLPSLLLPRIRSFKNLAATALPCTLCVLAVFIDNLLFPVALVTPAEQRIALNFIVPLSLVAALLPVYLLTRTHEKVRQALSENNEKLTLITENILDVFWMTDPGKKEILYVSKGFEKVWGRSCESLYREPASFVTAIHHEDRDRVIIALKNQVSRPYDVTYRVVQPNGATRWVRDRAFLITGEEGEVLQVCGLAIDITEQKMAQELITDHLAKVTAAARLTSLAELSKGVAHELNSPLGTILLLSSQIQGAVQESSVDRLSVVEASDQIEQCTRRISQTIMSLQKFSRDGTNEPPHNANLKDILEDALRLCSKRLSISHVELTCSIPNGPIELECRSTEILQVIVNLLVNSAEAVSGLPQANRWVRLDLRNEGGWIEFSITDSGPGIPLDEQSPNTRFVLQLPVTQAEYKAA